MQHGRRDGGDHLRVFVHRPYDRVGGGSVVRLVVARQCGRARVGAVSGQVREEKRCAVNVPALTDQPIETLVRRQRG